ncbi:MAG: ExbD/TolR family protein [Thermodesulfobacteriota bacterium]
MRRLGSFGSDAEDQDDSINMTPMLDVMFILLIFFIVTASFVKESGIEVSKPEAETSEISEGAAFIVAIDERDEIWAEGRRVTGRALRSVLSLFHAEQPKGMLVIQADKSSTNEALVLVMDTARNAGVRDISIATEK